MYIVASKANTSDMEKLSKVLQYNTVDLLSIVNDGASCESGISGLTYTKDCFDVFNEMHSYILSYAHDNNVSFESVDAYVWYYVDSHVEEVVSDWLYRGYVYECEQCGQYQYEDHQYEVNDIVVCSQDCVDDYWNDYNNSGKDVTIQWTDGTTEEVFISFEEDDTNKPWDDKTFFNMHGNEHDCVVGYTNDDGWSIIEVNFTY